MVFKGKTQIILSPFSVIKVGGRRHVFSEQSSVIPDLDFSGDWFP
jgi:hypothetical protein